MDAQPHQELPPPTPRRADPVETTFNRLLATWREETKYLQFHKIFQHPAYQAIIALGMDAVPLILREMEKKPCHLGHALATIVGEHPITNDMAGDLVRRTEAWLAWGRSRGYI